MTDADRQAAIRSALSVFATERGIPIAEVGEVWGERAAIREYDGGLRHRRNAELHAVADTFETFNDRVRKLARRG